MKTATTAYQIHQFWLEPAILAVSPDTADMVWVGTNQPDSVRIGSSPSRVGASRGKKKKTRGRRSPTRHRRAVSGVPRASPRCAASDAGAAPLAPCPCILGVVLWCQVNIYIACFKTWQLIPPYVSIKAWFYGITSSKKKHRQTNKQTCWSWQLRLAERLLSTFVRFRMRIVNSAKIFMLGERLDLLARAKYRELQLPIPMPSSLGRRHIFLQQSAWMVYYQLESTDAAGRVAHPSPTQLTACRCRVWFFFSRIRADSARFALMRLDSRQIGFHSRRIRLIQPKSGRISHIGSYRPATDTAETGRNRPWNSLEQPKFWPQICFLPSSFFVLWIKYINMFFKNILIVKIYRKYK